MDECRTAFLGDGKKVLTRNAMVNIGLYPVAIDNQKSNKVNHIFLNTIKGEHVKATNQEASGRCWMFAGLNMFRHFVIKIFDLKNFEFSEIYLFFWDKIERADMFLQEMIELSDEPIDHYKVGVKTHYSERLKEKLEYPILDGGYWNYFASLVDKYGLVPKTAMDETVASCNTDEMNEQLNTRLREATCFLRKKKRRMTPEQIQEYRKTVMKQIYDIVAFFLGQPPEKFQWSFTNKENESQTIIDLHPKKFKEMILPDVSLSDDFVVLANYPIEGWPEYQLLEIKQDMNIVGGRTHKMLNLPSTELEKYVMRSVHAGWPVWFTGDVSRGFHPRKAALNEELINNDLVLGKSVYHMNKGERFLYNDSFGNHAMTIIGYDVDEKGKPDKWQVENSWGYYDDEEPGEDGFLTASAAWFRENVYEAVLMKKSLSRHLKRCLKQPAIQLKSWGEAAKCKCKGHGFEKGVNSNIRKVHK